MSSPTLTKGLDALKKREAALKQKLKAVIETQKALSKKEEATRKIIIADAVIAHAMTDIDFARSLAHILKNHTLEEQHDYIADLLNTADHHQARNQEPENQGIQQLNNYPALAHTNQ
jgi:vacuolar-type H+-ATPase subunit D/Vma8